MYNTGYCKKRKKNMQDGKDKKNIVVLYIYEYIQ